MTDRKPSVLFLCVANSAEVKAMLDKLAAVFGAERAIRADHAKLRKSCGPGACK